MALKKKHSLNQPSLPLFSDRAVHCLHCGSLLQGRQRKFCSRPCQRKHKRIPEHKAARIRDLSKPRNRSFYEIARASGVSIGTAFSYGEGMRRNRKEPYYLLSPEGISYTVPPSKIGSFCEAHRLSYHCIWELTRGVIWSYKGWSLDWRIKLRNINLKINIKD